MRWVLDPETAGLKDLTEFYYGLSNKGIQIAIEDGELIEVKK